MELQLPETIRAMTDGLPYTVQSIGKSGSTVLCFENMVLKIDQDNEAFRSMLQMMQWLQDKLPVPRILSSICTGGKGYLLMSRVPGKMACDREYMQDPDTLVGLLAEALRMLWRVDVSDCPKVHSLADDLAKARYRVENGLVDVDDVEPETFGEGGFESPAHLLRWLEENRPEEELVLSHGDFCLPNVFFENGCVSGYIDLGDTGISDRWRDVALCYRSLKHNFGGKYSAGIHEDLCPDILFEKLGVKPNREKIRYYILLDELF